MSYSSDQKNIEEQEIYSFSGPFSMALMEDSSDFSDNLVSEVLDFCFEQYGIRIDAIEYKITNYIELGKTEYNCKQSSLQNLKILKRNNKIIASLYINSELKLKT